MGKQKIIIFFLVLIGIAFATGKAIAFQNTRLLYLVLGLGVFGGSAYIVKKSGWIPIFSILVFGYWILLDSKLSTFTPALKYLYPAEFGIWALLIAVLIQRSLAKNIPGNTSISKFPFLPFLLFIGGALATYFITERYGDYSIRVIRNFCLVPAAFCFLCVCLIKTEKQAERLLWIFLISAGLLGLVFLFSPQVVPQELTMEELRHIESGRLTRMIKLPLCGLLFMGAETTPINYAFIAALAFNFWLHSSSFRKRWVAAGLLLISILVIINAQGRGGLVAASGSIVTITVLSEIFRERSPKRSGKKKLKLGIVGAGLFVGFWYFASISTVSRVRERVFGSFNESSAVAGLGDRIWRWSESLEVIFEHPFFGVGLEGFSRHGYIYTWFAHNLYLYLWLSFGITGLVGFLWIFIHYARVYWSGLSCGNPERRMLALGGIGCVVVLLLAGITSSTFFVDSWQALMLWMPFGIIAAAVTLKSKERSS